MIDINKMIKMVKNGSIFRHSFNLKHKKADNTMPPEVMSPVEPIQQPQQPQQVSPVPSNIPVQMPQDVAVEEQESIPEELEERMRVWLRDNDEAIEYEGVNNDIVSLLDKKNNNPQESSIDPDIMLHRELLTNEEYKDILANMILENHRTLGKDKSSIFVDTMLAKTQGLMTDIGEREKGVQEDEERERLEQQKKDELLSQDPYALRKELPDPGLGRKLYTKIKSLNREKKEDLFARMKITFNDIMLSKSTGERFENPEGRKLDQRMNFFLNNPQFLEPIFQADPYLAEKLEEAGTVYRKVNILNNEKGNILYRIMDGLIDRMDPTILNWLKKGFGFEGRGEDMGKEISETSMMGVGEDAGDRKNELAGKKSVESRDSSITGADKAETSSFVSNITKLYLQNNLDEMRELNRESSQKLMEESKNDYMLNEKTSSGAEKKKLLRRYGVGEKLNSYFKSVANQLDELFATRGKRLSKDVEKMVYRNNKGELKIPADVIKEIMSVKKDPNDIQEEKREDLRNYSEYVMNYKDRIKKGEIPEPFVPDWKKMINYNVAMESMHSLGEIKNSIFEMRERGFKDVNSVIGQLSINSRSNELLDSFSNVGKDDDLVTAVKKRQDFVYMSLQQNPKDESLKAPLKAYENNIHINKLENEIKKMEENPSLKISEDLMKKKKELADNKREKSKNLKAIIGTTYVPLLAMAVDVMDSTEFDKKTKTEKKKYSQGSLRGFIELFDHHPTKIKNFMDVGQQINPYDKKKRTNTELYYKIKGEEPPEHVKVLFDLYRRGIAEGSGDPSKPSKNLKKGGWYAKLFKKYNDFDIILKGIEKKMEKIRNLKEDISRRVEEANTKVLAAIKNPKNKEKIINSISDPEERQMFSQALNKWDGMTRLRPLKYYGYLGQKKVEEVIRARLDSLKQNRQGIGVGKRVRAGEYGLLDLLKSKKSLEMELKKMMAQKGLDIDLSALKLASSMYKIYQRKLYKLAELKRKSYKLASYNNSYDIMINKTEKEFDAYFRSLFL